ncbi:MBL fold metallo-hydrolase [Tsukamurella spumae]|uniref:MBL fold metallo-hydrolase n=1 Tax=Tsukamurella spumae TaxID=44753 RepID=A0A846X3I5_9ACTN|nr:MBL fold metallo-hydrolase [Tsukamurella spumae]NKY20068.1 MBL fold metallo-hydrolase [Tsukamurella spumae]
MTTETIGRLSDQSAMRRLHVDDVTFTYVVDGPMALAAAKFLPSVPQDYWAAHPESIDADGSVAMTAGGLLVTYDDRRVVIDAGLGPMPRVTSPYGPLEGGAFPPNLARLAVEPSDVDHFLLTHIHIDHVGWAFIDTGDGVRTPFFPNATYVLSQQEWEPITQGLMPVDMPDPSGAVDPLLHHPKVQRVRDGQRFAGRISAIVTPGHTPGHASYVIETSGGRRLIAFGDAFHAPLQLSHPEWGSAPDSDVDAVLGARHRLLEELLEPDTYAFGTHFGDQPFGRVLRDSAGEVRWEPVATEVLTGA